MHRRILIFVAVALLARVVCVAQDETAGFSQSSGALGLFLDCDACDDDYVRREITFVDFVRDRNDSDIHLLIVTRQAGAGRAFELSFIGRRGLVCVDDTLTYVSSATDTEDERRAGLVQVIRVGLVRYLARTPLKHRLRIGFDPEDELAAQATPDSDPWSFWVFRIGFNGRYESEQSTRFYRIGGSASANRTTEDWKIRIAANGNFRESQFDVGDETLISTNRNARLRARIVRSLGEKWSAGGFGEINTSSFDNTDRAITLSPALEYNLFPYSESSRREFRFIYQLNLRHFAYERATVFDKTEETLLHHTLEGLLEIQQPWGMAEASIEVSGYLTDFSQSMLDFYRLELSGFIEFRLVRGFSVFGFGSFSRVRDQLFLPREEATEEEILLGTRQLPTDFEYGFTLGFSYTFGSIFNSIVNPRFGF